MKTAFRGGDYRVRAGKSNPTAIRNDRWYHATPPGKQGKARIFFFLKEKEAKRTSRLWLGVAATGEANRPLSVHRKMGG
jgi:hypothetical protein